MLTESFMPLRRSRSFSDPSSVLRKKLKRSRSFSASTSKEDESTAATPTLQRPWSVDDLSHKSNVYVKLSTPGITRDSPTVKGTTLFDSIPYHGVDKDEADYVEDQIRILQASDPDFGTNENDPDLILYKLTGFNRAEEPFDAGPVIQVISVRMFNTSSAWKGSSIFGNISLETKYKNVSIYKRESCDPELVSPHQELSLVHFPVAPGIRGKVAFNLFTTGGARIFDEDSDFYLDYSDYAKDTEEGLTVKGKDGYYAQMVYNIIPCATIAEVTMQLLGPADEKLSTIHAGGEVTAIISSQGIRMSTSKESKISLLKKKELKASCKEETGYIYDVELSRTAIAMPANSLLPVVFSLTRDGEILSQYALENDPLWPNGFGVFVPCVDKDFHIGLSIDWRSPDEAFDLIPWGAKPLTSDQYAEVFSVIVGCSSESKPPAVCGTIVLMDKKETGYIFSREAYCPDNLSHLTSRLSLAWPSDRWILEKDFFMHLKLKDVNGRSICRGYLGWGCDNDTAPSRFNRRMCSVIRGENGYFAAVHYTLFRDALRAKVTVTIDCEGPFDNFDVYGGIFAEYDNYDYLSTYDKDYYRIIIFDRPEEYCAKVINTSEIPLSKSLVTAPSNCKELSVFVNLNFRAFKDSSVASTPDLLAMRRLRFMAGTDDCQQVNLFPRGLGVPPKGGVTVKVVWFDCSHGYRVTTP